MKGERIILIGYRGTGKTTVGRMLAERLGLKLIDMDRRVTEKAGLSIPEIVEKWGWERFRDLESEVTKELTEYGECVVDSGGGVILREKNVANLRRDGIVILLTANVERIIERMGDGKDRPSLTGSKSSLKEVEEVLQERKEKYEKAADYAVDTSRMSPREVAERILSWLKG